MNIARCPVALSRLGDGGMAETQGEETIQKNDSRTYRTATMLALNPEPTQHLTECTSPAAHLIRYRCRHLPPPPQPRAGNPWPWRSPKPGARSGTASDGTVRLTGMFATRFVEIRCLLRPWPCCGSALLAEPCRNHGTMGMITLPLVLYV